MEEKRRCRWVEGKSELYLAYHDSEWGVPVRQDEKLYELFLLETFQAGLSWITVLKKREAFRTAFDGFDAEKIARYDEGKIEELLGDAGIIRSRRKIEAAVVNARIFLGLQREYGSFARYLWGFTGGKIICGEDDGPRTKTELSDRISADLIGRGMKYVGSVTVYSYLQAVGVVNDHEKNCFRRGNCSSV